MTTPHDQAIREAAEKLDSVQRNLMDLGAHYLTLREITTHEGIIGLNSQLCYEANRIKDTIPILRDLVAKGGWEAPDGKGGWKKTALAYRAQLTAAQAYSQQVLNERGEYWNRATRAEEALTAAQDEVRRLTKERDHYKECYRLANDAAVKHAHTVATLRAAAEQAKGALEAAVPAMSALIILGEQNVPAPYLPLKERCVRDRADSALTALSAALNTPPLTH